jgi:hypothetical protein
MRSGIVEAERFREVGGRRAPHNPGGEKVGASLGARRRGAVSATR